MKKHFKIFFVLLFLLIGLVNEVRAGAWTIYPAWGYDADNHLCRIKQMYEDGPVQEGALGIYASLRDCRSQHPAIIFYTGQGILIWLVVFVMVILFNYVFLPDLKKLSPTDKAVYFVRDIVVMGVTLFFVVLLQHYYDIPRAYYDYLSDIDHIIYSTFIQGKTAMMFGVGYFLVCLGRGIFLRRGE